MAPEVLNSVAGSSATTSATLGSEIRPSMEQSSSIGYCSWMPGVPVWQAQQSWKPTSFSARVWGAWSDDSMSMVPSLMASHTASRWWSGTQYDRA